MSKRRSLVRCVSATLCVGLLSSVVAFGAPKVKDPPAPPPPPPPPPVVAEYTVIDVGPAQAWLNEDGQVLLVFPDRLELVDPSGVITIPAPDALPSETLELLEGESMVTRFFGASVGEGGVIMGALDIQRYADGNPVGNVFRRPFVAQPGEDGKYAFQDIGPILADCGGIGLDYNPKPYISLTCGENNTMAGIASISPITIGEDGSTQVGSKIAAPFRIAPIDTADGPSWYVSGPDDANALTEVLGPWTEGIYWIWPALDEEGGAYLWDQADESSYVVPPNCATQLPLGSPVDKFRAADANSVTGIAVGHIRVEVKNYKGLLADAPRAPAYVKAKTVDGARVWYEPGRDGSNTLLVKLGMLDGYTKYCTASSVNARGQIVGWGRSSDNADRGLIWRNGVAVDLNTLIDPGYGVLLTQARTINGQGLILCKGSGVNGVSTFLLVPIAPAE